MAPSALMSATGSPYGGFDLASFARRHGGVSRCALRRGSPLFSQGEPADDVFFLDQGQVQLSVTSVLGRQALVGILTAGDICGETCLASTPKQVATATCIADSIVVRLARPTVIRAVQQDPDFAEFCLTYLLNRSARLTERLISQFFDSSEIRLARILLQLSKHGCQQSPIAICNLDQEALAQLIGTSRSTTNYFMNKFRDQGYIRYDGSNYIVVQNSLSQIVSREDSVETPEWRADQVDWCANGKASVGIPPALDSPFQAQSFADLYGGIFRYKAVSGSVIYRQEEPADCLYFLERGRIMLKVASPQGKDAIVGVLDTGAFFGEECLTSRASRLSAAVCLVDSVAVRIEKASMLRAIRHDPRFAVPYLHWIVSHGDALKARLTSQLIEGSEQRLARVLLQLASQGDSPAAGSIEGFDQEALSQLVGTTRSRINYFMNRFRDLGYIDYDGKITVHQSLCRVILGQHRKRRKSELSRSRSEPIPDGSLNRS